MSGRTGDRWQQVQDLFAAALDLAPAERSSFVARRCGVDRELAREVLSLLEADEASPGFLDDMAADVASYLSREPEPAADDDLVGQTVGRYTIEQRLARGGMGTVYLARRSDGVYDLQLAVKVIHRGLDSEALLARFRTERQILARLQHPHIATLLDGGLTADGRPFLAMEYVEGRPIDVHCAEEGLGLRARLQLMRTVCEAVQHAHNNLVVHRDLKPSNIIVSADGVVKLMDFGIAKLLDPDDHAAGDAPETMPGLAVMTPGYAAPEQIRGEPVSTATDVFGLGVVLHRLLTGTLPFGDGQTSPREMARLVCETEPLRPSRLPATPGDPPFGRRRLAGDLDNICLKALRREPERRYNSPGRLADDLARYLDGRPVTARPATWRYRTTKLLQRYRRGFVAAAAVLTVTVGMATFYTGKLATERDRARRGEAKAEQVATFLTSLFALADPDQSRGADITAREILERGSRRIRTDLADQPEIQAAMLDVVGEVYHGLGLYDESRELLARALALKADLYGDRHLEYAASASLLGRLDTVTGRLAAADSLLGQVVAIRRAELGPHHLAVADALQGQAMVAVYQGRPEAAEALYHEALAIYAQRTLQRHPPYATCLNDLALLLLERGDPGTAEPMFREALTLQRAWLGEDHPEVANTLYNLALLLRERGDWEAAEPIQRQVLALDRQLYGDHHPNVAYSLMGLGALLDEKGNQAEAERAFAEAYAMRGDLLPPGHPEIIKSLSSLSLVRNKQGRYAEAEAGLREAVALTREHLGEKHQLLAGRLNDLGWLLHDTGRYEEAIALHRESLALNLELRGDDHKYTAIAHMHLARSLGELRRYQEALSHQQRALAIARERYGDDNVFTATNQCQLAGLQLDQGRVAEAEAEAEAALTNLRAAVGPESPRLAGALHLRARIHRERGEVADAERLYRQAIALRRGQVGDDHPLTAYWRVQLADMLLANGRRDEALPLLRSGREVLAGRLPAEHPRLTETRAIAARAGI